MEITQGESNVCPSRESADQGETRETTSANPSGCLTLPRNAQNLSTDSAIGLESTVQPLLNSEFAACIVKRLEKFQTLIGTRDTTGLLQSIIQASSDKIYYGKAVNAVGFPRIPAWRKVPRFERYWVSDSGHTVAFTKKGTTLLKQSNSNGYRMVTLTRLEDGRAKQEKKFVHVLVAMLFIGIPPAGTEVNHKDFNRANNSYRNLEYLSTKANVIHSVRGNPAKNFKLDPDKVRTIREMHSSGVSQVQLARMFKVCKGQICHIIKGVRWQHVV